MIKLLVKNILERPLGFKWSMQGLGMLRTYLSDEVRLHVWDSSLKIAGVSPIHTHPWALDSQIVAGRLKQHRYKLALPAPHEHAVVEEFNVVTIKCGEGAHVTEKPAKIKLIELPMEVFREGESYRQEPEEIHYSFPDDGTVTLVKRTFRPDRDHAQVFWRGRGGWVDAAPRTATDVEIMSVCGYALRTWF